MWCGGWKEGEITLRNHSYIASVSDPITPKSNTTFEIESVKTIIFENYTTCIQFGCRLVFNKHDQSQPNKSNSKTLTMCNKTIKNKIKKIKNCKRLFCPYS